MIKPATLIVEAESLFNDGVAVVLFAIIHGAIVGEFSVNQAVLSFFTTVLGGAGIGLLVGTFVSRLTREYDDHLLEITLTTIVAYGSYLAAEHFHVSGVIAVVAASVVVGNYGMTRGMSAVSRVAVVPFWEYAAFAVNSMVFLLVGIEIANLSVRAGIEAIAIAICVVLASRAVSIYCLSTVLNLRNKFIPRDWQHVLVWSGLRGALSMAMVIGLENTMPERDLQHG